MPLSDYVEESEFVLIPPGKYNVFIGNVSGTVDNKCYVDIKYVINQGEFCSKTVSKRYYLSENTLKKFIPWQFGILGIWHEVKEQANFSDGVQVATSQIHDMIGKLEYIAEIDVESYTNNKGEERKKNNIILVENLGGRVPGDEFNSDEELPF